MQEKARDGGGVGAIAVGVSFNKVRKLLDLVHRSSPNKWADKAHFLLANLGRNHQRGHPAPSSPGGSGKTRGALVYRPTHHREHLSRMRSGNRSGASGERA